MFTRVNTAWVELGGVGGYVCKCVAGAGDCDWMFARVNAIAALGVGGVGVR